MWLCGVTLLTLFASIRRVVLAHIVSEAEVLAGISMDTARFRFLRWLQLQSQRWLLIVDNVDSADDTSGVLAWLLKHLPTHSYASGHVLITTRISSHQLRAKAPSVTCVDVGCLQPLQAAEALWLQVDAHRAHGTACGWAPADPTVEDVADPATVDGIAVPDSLLPMLAHAPDEFKALVSLASDVLGGLPLALSCAAGAIRV